MDKKKQAEVLKGPAKPADQKQAPLEKKPEALKKDQFPQKSNEIKEEAINTKEVKATNKNIKGGIKDEFKASDEDSDQNSNIRSKFYNNSPIKEITGKRGEEKVQQIVEQIEGIDLVKFLKAKGHSYFPKRIVNSKNIIKTIEYWLQYLYCSVKDCPYNAIITYSGESSDQIYCQAHADPTKHFTEPIVFRNELTESELFLHELEKELLYVQAKIIIAKSENAEDKSYESIIEDLDSKLSIIKSILNTMKGKVENLKEKFNTKKVTNKNEEFKYRSLSFIKQDCEKCSEINKEILAIISKTSLKKKIELFIQALDNECKEIQLDEEFKSWPYLEVPDEIYEKEFNILKVPLQSKILINNFEKKIKNSFKIIETNQKVCRPYLTPQRMLMLILLSKLWASSLFV